MRYIIRPPAIGKDYNDYLITTRRIMEKER
jgi:hypothetical protein